MALTKVKINLGTQGNLSGSRSIIQSTKTLVSSSAQIASNISGSFTSTSSSIASDIAGNLSSINTLNGTGTAQGVGTSDSPTFNNITATGTLTAQEIHTEFTSASIVFTSGSTKTGNSTDDIHQMTGSLNISGSLDVNDGNLSITDKMVVGSGSSFNFSNTNHPFTVRSSGNNAGFSVLGSQGTELLRFIQESNDSGKLDIYDGGSLKLRLSGHANETNYINNGGDVGIGIASPTTYYEKVLHIHESAGSSAIHLTNNTTGTTRDDGTDLIEYQDDFYIWSRESSGNILIGTNATERMRITSAGNVTFAGDLTIENSIPLLYMNDTSGKKNNQIIFQSGSGNIFRIGTDITTNDGTQALEITDGDGNNDRLTIDSSGDVKITERLIVGSWDNSNTHGHANLDISSDANEGADSYLNFKAGTTIKGHIAYDHHATAGSQAMKFVTGDDAVTAMTIEGTGDIKMSELLYVNNAVNHGRTTAGATFRAANNGNAAITLLSSANHSAGVGQDIVSLNFAANNEWSTTKDGVYAQIRCENGNGSYADRGQLVFAVGYNGNTIYDRMTLSYDGILGFDTGVPASATGATKGIHINTGGVPFIRYSESNSSGGTADFEIYIANGAYVLYDVDDSATVYSVSTSQVISGDFNDTSDVGLKENIKTIDSGLSIVNKLNPVTFDWKNKKKGSNSGFIAQEVEKLLPNDVEGEDFNTDYASGRVGDVTEDEDKGFNNFGKSINLGGIVAHLTKAVQELSEEVEKLKGK